MQAVSPGAGNGKPAGQQEDVPQEFECSICLKLLLEPVTVSCGHTFCRRCLEQSLGYRGACAVCRAPIVAGQGVNILLRSIVSERFPAALACRIQEHENELRATELAAEEERRLDALGDAAAVPAGPDDDAEGAALPRRVPRPPAVGPLLPLLQSSELLRSEAEILPYCPVKWEVRSEEQSRLIAYALQGSGRLGVIDGPAHTFDENARPVGICLKVEAVEEMHRVRGRVTLTGKFRFLLKEAPETQDGVQFGRFEPFFDTSLPPSELVLTSSDSVVDDQAEQPSAADLACEVARLLGAQLDSVGHGGRRIFHSRFGDSPPLPTGSQPATSASLERLSFFFLGALVTTADSRHWLASVDTRGRLAHCLERFTAAGRRPILNLPGAGSWMSPGQSAFRSFALLIAIVALFISKALGLFERGGYLGGFADRQHENNMQDALVFGQMLR